MKLRLLILGMAVLIFASCQKEKTTNNTVQHNNSTDGFGLSNKPLTGALYTYPPGVTQTSQVSTSHGYLGGSFFDFPADGDLDFYFSLSNANSTATTIIFPAGTVIPCPDTTLQGGVIVQPDTFVMPPASTYWVRLNAHCLNHNRTFYQGRTYDPLLISNNTNLNALIQLLATKKIVTNDYNHIVQDAVWDIAAIGSLTPADIAAINALP